ncbi:MULTISPECIES: hypothetical protein [unclassified Streptomyces]|uniref:hypothetical protein n=1 Tax=unclassified Streptomyces TaxID=2593676 RepID=UPI0023666044|nr:MULTISPECIES: hypothetical protein [unclassified Streptomyces]MDF3140221.1 hypothetical protein [Streptomyces sp. T21Q-yed]WDF38205.1 hypothetical protein PBV52_16070 [Streptomyces sp. T12]
MADRLPLLSTQLGFALTTERTGQRISIHRLFRMPPSVLSAVDLNRVLHSIMLRNPTLSYRMGFSRGEAYQERYSATYDFAEVQAEDEEAVIRLSVTVVDEFEASLDGAAMAAHLVRSHDADYLLLVFDHALVDGTSQDIMIQQLAAPGPADDGQWERFEAAVRDRAESESAAAGGRGVAFWADRLKNFHGELPERAAKVPSEVVPIIDLPAVASPSTIRGSYFPYALFSLHRALRDVTGAEATAVAYPWGRRNEAFSDVTGCFLNTAISLDLTGPRSLLEAMDDFLDDWYLEIDHADVPFVSLAGLGSAFSGSVAGMFVYTIATEGSVNIAGIEAVEVSLRCGHNLPMSAFTAGAAVREHEIGLDLMVDEGTGYGAQDLGTRWHHRLTEAFSCFPARQS